MNDLKIETEKLDKIITVRMTDEDYRLLKSVSQNSGKNVSITIRYLINMVTGIVKNNSKSK
jgi:predicted DNA-binding protein